MAERIIIEPGEVWEHFEEHEKELSTKAEMIATNSDYGIEICLTEDNGLPSVIVSADGELLDEESYWCERDCTDGVREMYDKYLSKDVIDILTGEDNEYTLSEQLEIIDERESEIDDALYDFLTALAPNFFEVADNPDEICEELKDNICEYLFSQHGISVYRPMFLEDEDGTDYFTEFPYPEMELED